MPQTTYTNTQRNLLVLLRLLIGWHFLYEGITKLWNPNWSAGGYLADSAGIFRGMFFWIADNPSVLQKVDFLNIWALIFIGLSLLTGLLTRWALWGGILLLGLYYLSHPPLMTVNYALPSEGSYLYVNKNLIELFAMAVLLAFPTSHLIGLDRFLSSKFKFSNR